MKPHSILDTQYSIHNTHNAIRKAIPVFIVISLLGAGLCGCQNKRLYKDTRIMMGTFVEVTSSQQEASQIVFAEIARIENLLSKYKEESEISQLNKLGVINASPETFFVIKKAKEFWQASEGAFDISVGALTELWKIAIKDGILPAQEKIAQALKLTGSDKIILQEEKNMVKFGVSGMKLDLGAIAKGYAVDSAVEKLKKAGINNCLINAGGDIYCLGEKFNEPWNIAVQDPRKKGFLAFLELKDKAIATSGDYEQYFVKGSRRYAHIIDPKTGYPAGSGVASVTVISKDCLTADALATAIFVLGKEKAGIITKRFPDVDFKIALEKEIVLR